MALKKKRVGPLSKKQVVPKKKKVAVQKGLLKKSPPKKPVLPEITDLYERARWKKERREYWRNRFRKILAAAPLQSKAKK
jgi:hypothetical protein